MNFLKIRKQIAKEISEILNESESEIINLVQKSKVGDIESRVAFRYAKQKNMKPVELAEEIRKGIKGNKWEITNDNGYLNFKFKEEFYVELLNVKLKREIKEKVIVEFPSVNPNKPLHVGHLRCALLGDVISNILEEAGYEVVRMDYIDDLGVQVAQVAWYIHKMKLKSNKKYDYWLGEQYVDAAKYIEENKECAGEVEELMHKMERGESPFVREMCRECVKAQRETLQELGVVGDVMVWESEVVGAKLLNVSIDTLERLKILLPGEGKHLNTKVVKLSTHEKFKNMLEADKVFVRANGVATYTAKDMAFQMWKFGLIPNKIKFELFSVHNGKKLYSSYNEGKEMEWNCASKIINVIGMEQKYPQEVIKTVFELSGYPQYKNYVHLSYGHAKLADLSFSGRKGTWMGYTVDEVLKESELRAYNLINEKYTDYSESEKKEISKKVGLGAVRYSFIKINPEKEIVFDWDTALSFEGDSGPYLQYAYARAGNILNKVESYEKKYKVTNEYEKELIKKIIEFEDVLITSAEEIKPNKIAEYSLELCSLFNSFYVNCPVLNEQNHEVRNARIKMVKLFIEKLGTCLNIMGIPIIERM